MSGRRLIAVLVGIIGLLVLVVAVVFLVIQPGQQDDAVEVPVSDVAEGEALEPTLTPFPTVDPGARIVKVVVSFQTVPRGWQMTEAELEMDERLASEVPSDVITKIEDAVGLYARQEIFQGQTLTADNLVSDPTLIGVEDYGPSSLIPPGYVAMAVPMDRLSSVAYGLRPGDHVDVMLSFTLNALDQEFQTLLFNSATFYFQEEGADGQPGPSGIFVIDPYGRFETLPTGDLAHIGPAEDTQRPMPVSVILQSAKVIQVGLWTPPLPAQPPTPTPEPDAPTPTPGGPPPTPTPSPPNVLLLAMTPQEQLFLKYAVEVSADIDFALRSKDDAQIYTVQSVDISFLLQQFEIDIPPNAIYSVGGLDTTSLEAGEVQTEGP